MLTDEQLLEKVEEAYLQCLQGQDFTMGDKRLTKARLESLAKEMERLKNRIARKSGTGGKRVNIGIVSR